MTQMSAVGKRRISAFQRRVLRTKEVMVNKKKNRNICGQDTKFDTKRTLTTGCTRRQRIPDFFALRCRSLLLPYEVSFTVILGLFNTGCTRRQRIPDFFALRHRSLLLGHRALLACIRNSTQKESLLLAGNEFRICVRSVAGLFCLDIGLLYSGLGLFRWEIGLF